MRNREGRKSIDKLRRREREMSPKKEDDITMRNQRENVITKRPKQN